MEPIQSSMARAALEWTVQQLADAAGVGLNTVRRFEAGEDSRQSTVKAMREAFSAAGIVFLEDNGDGPGIRFKKRSSK